MPIPPPVDGVNRVAEPTVEKRQTPIGTPEEGVLERYEKSDSNRLDVNGGNNEILFVSLRDDGAGIFKPKAGEKVLREHTERGTYFLRERAAYLLDRFLGFQLVPPTVIREIDEQVGSFQQFIPDTKTGYQLDGTGKFTEEHLQQQLMRLWIFDYIIYNSDRHGYNFLVQLQPAEKIHAIDNGLSFTIDYFSPFREFFDQPLPGDILQKLEAFVSWPEGKQLCAELLAELLDQNEIACCLWRIETVTKMLKQHHNMLPIDERGQLTFGDNIKQPV